MAENLAELCPAVIHKKGFVNNKRGYVTGKISRQGVEGTVSFLL